MRWHAGRMGLAWLSLLLVLLSREATAQAMTGYPAADSAAVARAAWARAAAARRAGDAVRARDEAAHAALAWPTQPAYALGWAAAAARIADTASVLRALTLYASVGFGYDARTDTTFASYLRTAPFVGVGRMLTRNAAPRVHSRARTIAADSTFWPEGLDSDPRSGRLYLTSVRHGAVAEVAADGQVREVVRKGQLRGAVLAARVDTARNALWLTLSGISQMDGYQPADSTIGALVRVALSDGRVQRRWNLPAISGAHALGDLIVSRSGDVFLTDSNEPVLYRLRAASDTLEMLRHPLFRSLQGMAESADGAVLYVADYSHGLLRVELATNAVSRLDDAPQSSSLGCDGIVFHENAIIAVQNGVSPARLMRFTLDETGHRIVRSEVLDQNSDIADEPTSVIVRGGDAVYVADSQWEKYDRDGRRRPNTLLRAPILLAVPLATRGR